MKGAAGRSGRVGWIALGAVLALLGGPLGWVVSDRIEQNNDFCTSCHLTREIPLHREIRSDFDATQPGVLAAVHGAARWPRSEAAADPRDFRCIDCHGGTSLVGRARVKALALRDLFWYVTGHFEEPTGMRWPLWDEDCAKCHSSFEESEPDPWASPRFHQLAVHNVDLGVDCVECHQVHRAGGNPDAFFVRAAWVRGQCARCHAEFE